MSNILLNTKALEVVYDTHTSPISIPLQVFNLITPEFQSKHKVTNVSYNEYIYTHNHVIHQNKPHTTKYSFTHKIYFPLPNIRITPFYFNVST